MLYVSGKRVEIYARPAAVSRKIFAPNFAPARAGSLQRAGLKQQMMSLNCCSFSSFTT